MQQVKKQLQDAIKNLKSDWGINEVKREDLAAVLEKVVAAVDRAAQLPVVPAQPEYVGGVIRGIILKESDVDYESLLDAPSAALPAFLKRTSQAGFSLGFYNPGNSYFYTRKNNRPAEKVLANCLIEYNGILFYPAKEVSPSIFRINMIKADDAIVFNQ